MQLSRSRKLKGVGRLRSPAVHAYSLQLKPLGFWATGKQIWARETPLGLYKGLGAVISGIVPKMAIRFASFESESSHSCGIHRAGGGVQRRGIVLTTVYKGWMSSPDGKISPSGTFIAGLGAGATEAVMVVNPMEVVKIRLQAQQRESIP